MGDTIVYMGEFDEFLERPVYAVFHNGDYEDEVHGTLVKPGFEDVHGITYFIHTNIRNLLEPLASDASVYADMERTTLVGEVFAERM